jgi:precorrin-2 dehydrogenase/sirohydrochlorin ferrochelatase
MRYLPVQLDVRDRAALVVGATGETAAKVARLHDAGARVIVVAPGEVDASVAALAASGAIELHRRAFEERDLDGVWLVYASPDDEALAARLHAWALAERRWVAVGDRPAWCTFVSPAIAAAPGLTIAIGTGGQSPGLARRLRQDLERLLADPRLGRYLAALRALRERTPRHERFARMRDAVRGFAIEARLVFPEWLDRSDGP